MKLHKNLTPDRWFKFSLMEQLANIGTDISRVINWRNKGDLESSRQAFERALELLYLTVEDPKNKKRLKEICRMREMLIDYFAYDNEYSSTDEFWQEYFYYFNYAAAIAKGK
ncbi:hypothetical protein M1446_03705 [Candidatus Dependentiae bacterium]|nr:hypothetical protein [Candidatus Dependentiae bacterium]